MLSDVHTFMAWVVVTANGLAGAWALAGHYVEGVRHRALWVLVAIAQVLLFVQVALGVARLQQLEGEAPEFHTFYGFLTLIAVAILYGYRTQLTHIRYLLYGGGSLFIMGLAIRAMMLDATPLL
ncbi:MAG: hypothetical protein ACI88C_001598 [Acidimicrobiales bacterium]|jgi:hypothetical protein|tara:strand:+ start:160 stop:531 length:372 start_codon:yes stop_codon:yes gene_type:complete